MDVVGTRPGRLQVVSCPLNAKNTHPTTPLPSPEVDRREEPPSNHDSAIADEPRLLVCGNPKLPYRDEADKWRCTLRLSSPTRRPERIYLGRSEPGDLPLRECTEARVRSHPKRPWSSSPSFF